MQVVNLVAGVFLFHLIHGTLAEVKCSDAEIKVCQCCNLFLQTSESQEIDTCFSHDFLRLTFSMRVKKGMDEFTADVERMLTEKSERVREAWNRLNNCTSESTKRNCFHVHVFETVKFASPYTNAFFLTLLKVEASEILGTRNPFHCVIAYLSFQEPMNGSSETLLSSSSNLYPIPCVFIGFFAIVFSLILL